MQILKRIKAKLKLWSNFYKISANFFTVLKYYVGGVLKFQNVVPSDAFVTLKNGISLYYGKLLDVSTVPAVVEVWQEQVYSPPGFELKSTDVVFDVGANVGNFSLYASQKTQNNVYAFEPMPENFLALEKNLESNSAHNVTAVAKAVSGQDGIVKIHVSNVNSAHSITHELFGQGKTLDVTSVTLDSFCKENSVQRIDFLKLDCEGAEFEIILGLSDDLVSRIGKIVIEHHGRYVGRSSGEIVQFLEKHGFTVREYDEQYISAIKI